MIFARAAGARILAVSWMAGWLCRGCLSVLRRAGGLLTIDGFVAFDEAGAFEWDTKYCIRTLLPW
jgi:hypothetical protein